MNFNNLITEITEQERESFLMKSALEALEEKSLQKEKTKQRWAGRLVPLLYQSRIIQTMWNTESQQHARNGWTLKNGSWSPWFLNLRALGNFPRLFKDVCYGMAEMICDESHDFNTLVGIEMAGIPLTSRVALILDEHYGKAKKSGYTRPLPQKPRTPEEALKILSQLDLRSFDYGQKSFVEVGFENKDRIALVDDMATDLGSKLIARLIVLWEAERRGIKVECNKIFYFLNRNRNNLLSAEYFAHALPELKPAKLEIGYLIEFDECLPILEGAMRKKEFEIISEFQKKPLSFQKKSLMDLVKNQARMDRHCGS